MAPDVSLILISTLFTLAGYLLWIVERLPRLRIVLSALAVVTFFVAVFFHSTITSRQSEAADLLWGTEHARPAAPDAA